MTDFQVGGVPPSEGASELLAARAAKASGNQGRSQNFNTGSKAGRSVTDTAAGGGEVAAGSAAGDAAGATAGGAMAGEAAGGAVAGGSAVAELAPLALLAL